MSRALDQGEPKQSEPVATRQSAYRGISNVPLYLRLALPVGSLFALVYFGMNWITAQRTQRYRLYFDWELSLPFLPAMVYPYASILLLFLLPPLLLTASGLRSLARAMVVTILLAALSYLLLPAELGFERPAQVPGYDPVYQALYALALPHNLVPSLHVTSSALCIAALLHAASSTAVRLGLLLWGALISAAVLLVHQHHLLDVISGWLLGLAAYRLVYLRGVT